MLIDIMRPHTFDEMVGNTAIKSVFKGQIENNNVSHTILLVGNAGTGKTTTARILAAHLNSQVEEINCGAETGIDTIRNIIEAQSMSPLTGDTRLYILDEAHALSKQAQNALLKPAEEPSESTYFILCTSEPDKLEKALRSRCLELKTQDLTELSPDELKEAVERLLNKLPDLKFESKKDLNSVIQEAGDSYRNLYNTLEKLYSAGLVRHNGKTREVYVNSQLVRDILGTDYATREESSKNLTELILKRDLVGSMLLVKDMEKSGIKPYSAMLGVYRYMKAVHMKRGMNETVQATMAETALFIAKYDVTWLHVEHFILKMC